MQKGRREKQGGTVLMRQLSQSRHSCEGRNPSAGDTSGVRGKLIKPKRKLQCIYFFPFKGEGNEIGR